MPDQFEKYYTYLKSNGADVAPDFNSFKNTLSNYDNASKYYTYLKDNKFDVPETYDLFADTFGLKKKIGGAISSLTELPSEFIEPLKKGISPDQPKEAVNAGIIIPTNLPKQDEMRYERELKTQDAAVNTLTDIYKQKGLKFDPSKPAAQKQIQEYITKERDNDLSRVVGIKDGKQYLVRSQGFFESAGESLVRSITNPIESTSINMTNDAYELANLLDDKIKKEPNIPEATPSKFSGYLGELGGGLPKMMALLAIPYAGESAMVGEMYYNALANQRRFLYEKGLEDGMDRITSAKNAMKNAPLTAIPDAVVAAAMARGIGGKGGSEMISGAAKESFFKAVGGGLKGVAKVSAIGGAAEFGRSKAQQSQGYKVTDAEAIENGLRGAGDYAIMDAAFKLAHAGKGVPKYLSSAAKNVLSSIPKEIVEVAADNYSDGKQTLEEVQIFANTKAKVADFVPESKVASVTGLTEKTDNLKKDIEALEENKKAVPPSVAVEIDNQIKDKNKEVEFYDNQIKKVLNSKDETGISEEIDDVTGEKIGAKKYIVDGKEVSQAEFEAELAAVEVKEEVKPTEAKTASLEEEYDSKSVDELIALKKKLYPSPDIESPMTPEEKLLDRVIAKKFSEKQQEIISKRKAAEKAPTKELAEGEEVTFNTLEGKKLTGEKIIIPGFEKIDMIMVKEGLNNTVYDLASGMPISEGDFTKEGTIKSIKDNFEARNITQGKLYGQIYKGSNISSFENKSGVRQINPSSMFESYSEKRKAFDKAEYEKLPLKYTPKEIEDLNKLKDKAKENELDAIVAEIEEKTKERAKEGSYKPTYEFFDRAINKGIKEKTKKEAEKNKSPYPKEYIEPIKGTEESLAKVMMSGKKDKLSQVNPDVRKAIVDAWGKYADLYNKYGYKFSESMDEFVTSLLRYSGTLTSRENREEKLAIEQKRLKSSIEEMGKVYDKEFGKKAQAEVKPKEGEVKTYNAKDLKANPKVLEEDKDYYSLTYPKSFVMLFTDMVSLKNNGFENAKIGDVINIFKKDYVVGGFIENKKNPNKTSVKLIRVDKDGNLLREQDLSKKEQKEGKAKEFEEEEEVEVEEPAQITKDDIKKAEAKFAAAEDRFKKARNKIEATQVKQTGMFGGEQKGMFAMGGEEAKSTLDPLRKAAKEAKAELDDIRNRIKVQEVAQPELAPVSNRSDIEETADALKLFDEKSRTQKISKGQKDEGTKVYREAIDLIGDTYKFTGKGWENVSEAYYQALENGKNPRLVELIEKTLGIETPYQKALKEKQEADKRQNRQIGSEKAAATKEIFRKVKQMDAPETAEQIALNYLADGGKISEAAINEIAGNVKRAELNMGRREVKTSEVKAKDFVGGNETIDGVVHRLWEEYGQRVSESDIKNALMSEINTHNTRLEAAEAYLEQYNPEYIAEKEEMRLAEQEKEMYLEEQEKLEQELRSQLDEQVEGEASEEHINNLIDQYESEIKGEDQQFGPESEGEVNKEASKGNVGEKVRRKAPEKSVEEAYKDLTINQKRQIINSKFDELLKELKIEKICPT